MAKEYKDLVFGLDIGTAKVMVVAAEVLADGSLRVAGLGVASTHGLKRGVVVNIDATRRLPSASTSAATTMTLAVPMSRPKTRSLYSLAMLRGPQFFLGAAAPVVRPRSRTA